MHVCAGADRAHPTKCCIPVRTPRCTLQRRAPKWVFLNKHKQRCWGILGVLNLFLKKKKKEKKGACDMKAMKHLQMLYQYIHLHSYSAL